jgi:hypothetical protein
MFCFIHRHATKFPHFIGLMPLIRLTFSIKSALTQLLFKIFVLVKAQNKCAKDQKRPKNHFALISGSFFYTTINSVDVRWDLIT